MRPILTALALLAAQTVAAETPMTAEEFDDYTRGRTLTFVLGGEPYGIERYMADRRVIWSFLDGECVTGTWHQEGDAICFVYDNTPDDPQCWQVYDEGGRLRTVFMEEPARNALYEARPGDEELICENFGT